jgi:hypothetical protein
MKRFLLTFLLAGTAAINSPAATSINAVNKFAYGANIGWVNWQGHLPSGSGAVIGEFVCSGFIYSANVGWINLGGGTPLNGIRYQNLVAADCGVNHDGAGNLRGYAYGANIGWVHFEDVGAPKVDLKTGILSGFAYGVNVGWISLSNSQAYVQTDALGMGPDTDADGLPDDWERTYAGNLATLMEGLADNDGDGHSNAEEYLADTDPLDADSHLRITSYAFGGGGSPVTLTWTSRPTRVYRILKVTAFGPGSDPPFPWVDAGLGVICPDPGPTTTRMFMDPASPMRFFEIEVGKPLSL